MPREHELVPDGMDWVCKHCGLDATAITAGDLGHDPFPCVDWTAVPRVKRRPPPPAPPWWEKFFVFKRK